MRLRSVRSLLPWNGMPEPLPPDPVRRRLLKALGLIGLAGGAGAATRFLSRPERDPVAAGPATTTSPLATPTTSPTTTTVPENTTTRSVVVLSVFSKAAWGGREPGELTPHDPVRLTVHHTASQGADVATAPERIRGYQRFHIAQGWPDVAYHYLIDQAGRVYQGRPPEGVGDTFTEYDPTGHFLVCLDGNFDTEMPSARSLEALAQVLAWAVQEYRIDRATLAGHRDYADLSCPGDNLYARLPTVADRLVALADTAIDMRLIERMG